MKNDKEKYMTVTEASENFSEIAGVAENDGQVIIYENDKPKFVLIDINSGNYFELTDEEKIDIAAKRVLKKFKPAFEELAK